MSLDHEANGVRHISAEQGAIVRNDKEDSLEDLIRSIRAATHQASPTLKEKPTRLPQPDMLVALNGSTDAGSYRIGTSSASSGELNDQSIPYADDALATHLKGMANGLDLSRHAQSFAQDYFSRLDARTRHVDALDTEKWELQEEVAKLGRLHDRAAKELARKSHELSIASATIAGLQVELDRIRQAIAQADRQASHREARFLEANVEVECLGRNLARISEQLRDEIMARQAAEQTREDAAARIASLEQAAMLLHSKVADYQLVNEQLTGKLSRQMAVQQELQARLSTVEHERGVLKDCASAAQERAAELERELHSLQRRATALFADQAMVRTAPGETRERGGEATGLRRQTSEAEIAKLREERDVARRDHATVKAQLADLRLRGMTDELALARCRDENRELHRRLETLTRQDRMLQDRHAEPAADETEDLERAFDGLDLLATGELSAANDGDPGAARKAS